MVTPLTIDELAEIILPWADATHPEKAMQVRAQSHHFPTYHRWLARLVEIRYIEDLAWRPSASLRLLQETGLAVRMLAPDGSEITVCGRYAPKPWRWTFAELAVLIADEQDPKATFILLQHAKTILDLDHCNAPRPSPRINLTERRMAFDALAEFSND